MKTKLSFLVLPCLAFIFALAACSGDSGNNPAPAPTNSSSSGNLKSSSSQPESDYIRIEDFVLSYNEDSTKINIFGTIWGTPSSPITSVEFTPAGYVDTASGVTLSGPGSVKLQKLTIDLEKASIPCGNNPLNLTACVKIEGKQDKCPECCEGESKTFNKVCVSSSSSAVSSSSSEAGWKFGTMDSISISLNTLVKIPNFNAEFRLEPGQDNGIDATFLTIVANGDIRDCKLSNFFAFESTAPGFPIANKVYPSDKLNSMVSQPETKYKLDIVGNYYMVSSGAVKYLIRIEAKDNDNSNWADDDLPKQIRYWKVIESPN